MKLRIIPNKFIPFKGYTAIIIGWWLFVRTDVRIGKTTIHHESIHHEQQKEMLIVLFLLWYIIEWLIKLAITFDCDKAYRNISFEREAYQNQTDEDYLDNRKRYSWMRYIFIATT